MTKTTTYAEFEEILRQAMMEELGIVVNTNNPKLLRQRLYRVRNALELPLSFVIPEHAPDKLWIVRKQA